VSVGYLERYFDESIRLPSVASREELEAREIDRILKDISVILLAGAMPNRVSPDPEAIQLDRRRARRVGHALSNSLKGWTKRGLTPPVYDELRREAAQLDWEKWLAVHVATVERELALLATWAIRTGERKWGKSAVVKLENEIHWVQNSLRE